MLKISPIDYLSKPFLNEDDPYNPKCRSLIQGSFDNNIYLPKQIYTDLNDPH